MGGAGEGVLRLRILAVPVLVAALVQALLALTSEPEIAFDSPSYIAQAEALVSSGSALNEHGEPDTKRTPGYPLFLAVFFATPLGLPGAIAAQRLLWVGVVAATALAAGRTSGRSAALVAGMITAIDLPALQATNSVLTETLAAVVVGAAAWQTYAAITRRSVPHAVIAGALAGAAALVRPVAMLLGLPLAIAVWMAVPRDARMRLACALLAASLVLPAAWTLRNYRQTGVATFSSIGSINLLLYRAAGTLAIRDPGGIDAHLGARQAELERAACAEVERIERRPCADVPLAVRASYYGDIAIPIILADPVATAMQAARAFVMIVFGGGAAMLSGLVGISESSARLAAFAYTVPLAIGFVLGTVHVWRIDRAAALVAVLTIAYMMMMSLGAEAYSRFRVPVLPLYAMLAGSGAAAIANRWTGHQ